MGLGVLGTLRDDTVAAVAFRPVEAPIRETQGFVQATRVERRDAGGSVASGEVR